MAIYVPMGTSLRFRLQSGDGVAPIASSIRGGCSASPSAYGLTNCLSCPSPKPSHRLVAVRSNSEGVGAAREGCPELRSQSSQILARRPWGYGYVHESNAPLRSSL